MSMNIVAIAGNITRDPELRATQRGMSILSFGLAVNDRKKNQQTGEWEDYANFIDCSMFGSRAESLSRYLSKGTKIAVQGRLHYSTWEKNGEKRSKLEVYVDELEFMSRREEQQPSFAPKAPSYSAPSAPMPEPLPNTDVYGEDIPF